MSSTDAILVTAASGERALYVGPTLSESLPPEVLEGLTRRRLVATTGVCPCGASLVVPNRAARRAAARIGRVLHVDVEHEDDCAALDPRINRIRGCP